MDDVEGGVSSYCLSCRFWREKCVLGCPRVALIQNPKRGAWWKNEKKVLFF